MLPLPCQEFDPEPDVDLVSEQFNLSSPLHMLGLLLQAPFRQAPLAWPCRRRWGPWQTRWNWPLMLTSGIEMPDDMWCITIRHTRHRRTSFLLSKSANHVASNSIVHPVNWPVLCTLNVSFVQNMDVAVVNTFLTLSYTIAICLILKHDEIWLSFGFYWQVNWPTFP